MKIGAQLYTVRAYTQNELDLGRTLEKIAEIGYETVQVSAVGPIEPKKIKALCDANGLQIVLTHNPEARILNDVDKLIEEHQLYGCRYIGLGGMGERYRQEHWLPYFAEDFRASLEKIKAAGMHFMYHNHSFEFGHFSDGRTMMDHLLESVPADLMGVTADTYWLQAGGTDVNGWLAAHGDRLGCVHLKDMVLHGFEQRMAAVGQGNLNFPAIMRTLRGNGVTEYALVEQDECYGESPFECLKKSYDYLKTLE